MSTTPCLQQFPAKLGALSRTSSGCAPFSFTYDNLYKCLYQRNETQDQPMPENLKDSSGSKAGEKKHGEKLTFAKKSCPDELELCPSSTGSKYGIRTKQVIPEGTWMGPYQGDVVKPNDVTTETDTSLMWEIYENGKLLHFIDGKDENTSSWMRFIRCARHKGEQNLFAFQYNKEIYYRAFSDIPVGTELLVWYEDTYPQYMGIPLKITDIGLQVHDTNCAIHSQAPTEVKRTKQETGWKKAKAPPRHPTAAKRSYSAFVSVPHGYYHAPFCNSQPVRMRRKREMCQTDHCEQLGPVPQRRTIVINRALDAPDPFCILTRAK
ncbi:PR domain zinc finger protein 14-like [Oculina patagonica]